MKKLINIVLLVCIVMSMCTVSAWASPIVPFPEAEDITITQDGLIFAKKFVAKPSSPETMTKYGDWYADFELSFNKPVRLHADDPNADGYLSGQHDLFGPGWLNVPTNIFGNMPVIELAAGETVRVMEKAAELLNQGGLRVTYNDVYNIGTFQCGIHLNDDFLAANPDLQITLKLRMYDNTNPSYGLDVTPGEVFYLTPPAPPAPANPVTPAAPVVEDIYYIPATDDNSNMALWSILALALLSTAFVTRKRKNEN